jgi:hypothetical protein
MPAVTDFNKRLSKRCIKVESGIEAIKNKWRHFLHFGPYRRRTFEFVFEACYRLTNIYKIIVRIFISWIWVRLEQVKRMELVRYEWGYDPL